MLAALFDAHENELKSREDYFSNFEHTERDGFGIRPYSLKTGI
jgi:hypothetical protein